MPVSSTALNAIAETTMANMVPDQYVTAVCNVAVPKITKIVAEVGQVTSTTLNMKTQIFRSVLKAVFQQERVEVLWGLILRHVRRCIFAFAE